MICFIGLENEQNLTNIYACALKKVLNKHFEELINTTIRVSGSQKEHYTLYLWGTKESPKISMIPIIHTAFQIPLENDISKHICSNHMCQSQERVKLTSITSVLLSGQPFSSVNLALVGWFSFAVCDNLKEHVWKNFCLKYWGNVSKN